jgi:dTDP-4-amino-4,6-dideoxygalactose transaminase
MAEGVHKITQSFEEEISKYTGAKYTVALDNMSNALFLALYYENKVKNQNLKFGNNRISKINLIFD